jgi:hypothetical protein
MIRICDTPAGATFRVKVHPRAHKNAITSVMGDALKLALTDLRWTAAPTRPAPTTWRNF